MMQDSHGFMWMGTINGLNRYNGKDFVVIQPGIATFGAYVSNVIPDGLNVYTPL